MRGRVPLGEQESLRLEFKGRDSLKDLESIAREVVGFLNAEGGEVWVGLQEAAGRAVAVEPIEEPERERGRLQDYLIDTIEPPLTGRELEIEVVRHEEGPLLCAQAIPEQSRRPYAFLRKGGRHFVTRVGNRIRPMERGEIFNFNRGEEIKGVQEAVSRLLEAQKTAQERASRAEEEQFWLRELFWLRLQPTINVELNFDALVQSGFLTDPALTGNRRTGDNFTAAYVLGGERPQVRTDENGRKGLAVGREGEFWLFLYRDGGVLFTAPLESFVHKGRSLFPLALLEFPASIFRLAAAILQSEGLWVQPVPTDLSIVAHLALFNLQGWSLRAGSPEAPLSPKARPYGEDDFVLDRPLAFRLAEILDQPDRCAFRLIRRLYEAFGFTEDAIPREFDRKTGRLILPE